MRQYSQSSGTAAGEGLEFALLQKAADDLPLSSEERGFERERHI